MSESTRIGWKTGTRKRAARSHGVPIACAALLALLVAACGPEEAGRAGGAGDAGEKPAVLGAVPDFSLVDQRGADFRSADLRGQVWVANFIFTRCTTMCPILTREMLDLQSRMASDPVRERVRLVSFSVDPEHDRPAVLAEYAEGHGADPERWTFATGERAEIWELSKSGFKLPVGEEPKGADDPLFHSDRMVLVDAEGRIRGYYSGMESGGVDALVADLHSVAGNGNGNGHAGVQVATAPPAAAPAARTVTVPPDADGSEWLEPRAAKQRAEAASWKVFHDFSFADRRKETGIDWSHRIVDDAGRDYKGVHYDHGTGVAVADVDGDGLLDVYFVNQLGSNSLWRNLGGGRFEDITHQAGVPLFDRICVAAAFADIDNDGDPDLYVTSVRGGNALFVNEGGGRFKDASAESGLDYVGHSSGAVFFDYDRDGRLDLLLLNIGVYTTDVQGPGRYWVGFKDAFSGHLKPERNERSRLYRNLGGNRFEDVSDRVGLDDTRWSGHASPIDANGDGFTDIYVLNMEGFDGYWENVGGKRFVDKSKELFPRSSWGAMGIQVFDFDGDGDPDIFITDMHSDMSEVVSPTQEQEKRKADMQYPASFLADGGKAIYGNTFFRNDGDGRFVEVSDEIGAENFWPWGLSVADLNADGWEDAFVTSSMNYPFRYGINSLLLNDGGERFLDAEFVLGIEPRRGPTTKPWFELDCGGADKYHKDCPENGPAGRVEVMSALGTRSSVIFDLDGDGDLDIVTNEFNAEPLVFVSDLSERRKVHHLAVKLVGRGSNRDGLGARVEVTAGGRRLTQVHDGQSGYLSQSSAPLYFGLGDSTGVDEIRVTWPSGKQQKLAGPIEVDRSLEIEEPK